MNVAREDAQIIYNDIRKHLDDGRRGERLRTGVVTVIVGAPNVGKSSLLNILAQRPAAIVSDIPGTTRDVIEVALDLKGFPVVLVDTAGLRASADPIEKEGIRRTQQRLAGADIRVLMLDACDISNVPSDVLLTVTPDWLVVVNKSDISANVPSKIRIGNNEYPTHTISCHTGEGIDTLIDRIGGMVKQRHSILLFEN